jgi:hypothetical protein
MSNSRLAKVKRIAMITGIANVVTIAVFIPLSNQYFADRAATQGGVDSELIWKTRVAFISLTLLIGIAATVVEFSPRLIGHVLAGVAGVAALVAATAAIFTFHVVLPSALFLFGGLFIGLAIRSYGWRSREAWAFLVSLCLVCGLVTLFGATKIRNTLDIGLFHALMVPAMLFVAASALLSLSNEYRET